MRIVILVQRSKFILRITILKNAQNDSWRKRLGINKSTLWYIKKNISDGKTRKIYSKILEKQLLTSNFEVITDYIGDHVTKECRGIIHNNSELLSKLVDEETNKRIKDIRLTRYSPQYNAEHFSNSEVNSDIKLRMLLEPIRYVCSIYDWVGFLLQENEKLKERFIPYHRIAIINIWDKIEKVMELENYHNKQPKKYPEYETLVKWCKENHTESQTK